MKTQQEIKKVENDGSNVFQLETRSNTEEDNRTGQRTVDADNQFPVEKNNQGEICIRTINENIKNVFEGKALTMPLRKLNRDCRFKKMYDAYCDIKEGDIAKQKKKEYHKEYYKANKERIYRKRKERKGKRK